MTPNEVSGTSRSPEDEELLRYLMELEAGNAATPELSRRPAGEDAPLSFGQQRLWVLDQIEGGNPALHLLLPLRLRGPLDLKALGDALDAIVARHEVLRTHFVMKDLEPVQRVVPSMSLALPIRDLSDVPPAELPSMLVDAARELTHAPFDLAVPLLIRGALIRLGPEEHSLMLALHHAITDRWSLMLMVAELCQLYPAIATGRPPPLPPLPAQYGDYAIWERQRLTGQRLEELLAYWRRQLAGLEPLAMPTDRPRPAVQTFTGASASVALPRRALLALERNARAMGSTRFMALLTVFVALLQRYTGAADIAVGTPISNRNTPELEQLVGFFLNTLVLRVDASGDPTFGELLARVRVATLDAYAHQDVPFERIVRDLNPQRDLSRSPIFQVLFVQIDQSLASPARKGEAQTSAPALKAGNLTLVGETFGRVPGEEPGQDAPEATQYDLEVYVGEIVEGLQIRFVYNTALFESRTIRGMLRRFSQILESCAESADRRLSALTVLDGDERRLLLQDRNATAREHPKQCVTALVAAQAERSPRAVAVQATDGALTYAELETRVTALAAHLAGLGVGPGDRIAVCVDRTLDLPVSLLGVMASGAAYVPLDPGFPDDRLRYMLDDAQVAVVVTQGRLQRDWPGRRVIDLDIAGQGLWSGLAARQTREAGMRDLAYVIYTSGSTGRPKGVCVEHGALTNFLWSMRERPGLDGKDVLVSVTTHSFDIFGLELYLPLVTGARVVLASRDESLDGAALAQLLDASAATVLQATPATWRMLLESGWTGRKQLKALCGGEALPPALASRIGERVGSLWNLYGPTETTIWSTVEAVGAAGIDSTVCIGRPIHNTRVYVLDGTRQPVPVGVPGELWIGGAGLARGYWERPELTAERFLPDPFAEESGARMYRTGDLVRWRHDGRLEHLGRLDYQVKVRGYRIELGEVEAVLEAHEGVRQAVVLSHGQAGDTRLVAYVVGEVRDARALDAHLRARLPGYMVPGAWMFLDNLPLTPNGKVDRRALLEPDTTGLGAPEYVAPRTPLERTIAGIWCQVLGVERIGVRDGFFALGGHSLQLTAVRARLEAALGRRLPMTELFRFPTVESFAASLEGTHAVESVVEAARTRALARSDQQDGGRAVAIVGMGFRFPGAADPAAFWRVLAEGAEPTHEFTEEELREAGVGAALLANPNYVNRRGIIDGIELFDAGLFGYSPREAELLDPQQRLFLECAWEALENAGYNPRGMEVPVGVYAGSAMNGYLLQLLSRPDLIAMAGGTQALIGSDIDFLPMRVSYKLNLRGPSVNLQTTCSTSLVAVHAACRSLRGGDCDMALAGAANLRLPVVGGHLYQENGILSPDGHCRAFDAAGRGTLFGDGVGVVALKRLRDAVADGDTIHAVILGIATNNDGSDKVGFTAPNVNAQAEVIAAALADAGAEPASIGYVEAHGTATALGDPIEVAALNRVYAGCERGTCALGTVKTNFGHLDRVAGIAGLIKTVLALEHRRIPASLHFQKPNPEIDFDAGPFFVNTVLRDWLPRENAPLRAGVSSFGMGGTNAHAVLEEAPPPPAEGDMREWQLLPLSARSPAALAQVCDGLARHLSNGGDAAAFADVAHTLQRGRYHFEHRIAVVARDMAQAGRDLATEGAARRRGAPPAQGVPPVVFMFPGQGAQHPNMAQGLYRGEPVFREALDRCCEVLRPLLGHDLREVLFAAGVPADEVAVRLARTAITQPALFSVEYALARLWMAWGIRPAAMIGHSIGEYVAACLSGVLGLEDALGLVATRGALMERAPTGVMLAVLAPESQIVPLLGDELWLAAVNGPQACAVSGTQASIASLEAKLAAENIAFRRLVTSHAFHSGLMESALEPLAEAAGRIEPGAPLLRYVSNITGEWIESGRTPDAKYWARHMREPVRFDDGLTTVLDTLGRCVLLEVGPGRGLAQLVRPRLAGRAGCVAIASLGAAGGEHDDVQALTRALADLWVAGAAPDWTAYSRGLRRRRVPLPTYPFERKRYWADPRGAGKDTALHAAGAPLRMEDIADWFSVPTWQRTLAAPPLPAAVPGGGTDHWLVFADEVGLGRALAARLSAEGQIVTVVRSGDSYAAGGDVYTVRPAQGADYDALFRDLDARGRKPRQILYLWGVTGREQPDSALLAERCFYGPMCLVQSLGRRGLSETVRMTLVADEMHEVTGSEAVCPEKALLLGPCRVVPLEYPEIACRGIDVPQWPPAAAADQRFVDELLVELRSTDAAEAVVAYRNGCRWVPRHAPARLEALSGRPLRVRERGVYLITGGLGGIGLGIAGYLAEAVQARLVLVGRSGLPPEASWDAYLADHGAADGTARRITAVRELVSKGASVQIEAADVVDRQQMAGVMARIRERFGAVHGVIHAAGIAGGGLIQLKTKEAAAAVLGPKVAGTRILAELLHESPPDFVLLCSSVNALIGVPGQIDYTAANAYLDAFAARGRVLSPTYTVSVNWDTWGEAGMAVDTKVPDSMAAEREASLRSGISNAEGIEVFRRVMSSTWPQVLVSPRVASARRAATVSAPRQAADAAQSAYQRPDLDVEYMAPRDEMEQQVAHVWGQLLGIDRIGVQDNFLDLGGHSLLAIRLLARLRSDLNVDIALEGFLAEPTVEHMARRMRAATGPADGGSTADAEAAPALLARVYTASRVGR